MTQFSILLSVTVLQMVQLSYSDYMGPTIHATATARSRQYPSVGGEPVRERRANGMMAARAVQAAMKRERSVDIDAEPLSSTDEEELAEKTPEPTPKSKRIYDGFKRADEEIRETQRSLEDEGRAAAKPKKGKGAGAKQARRKKVEDDPLELTIAHNEEQSKGAEDLSEDEARVASWEEERAAKRMKPSSSRTYHGFHAKNIHTSATNTTHKGFQPVPSILSPSRPGRNSVSGFQPPAELKSPSLDGSKIAGFIRPTVNDLPERRKTRSRIKDQEHTFRPPDDVLSPRSATANSSIKFKLPPDSTTSSAATTDHASTVFSHTDSPPLVRSGSVSSLSSVGSIASLLLTQEEKDELMKDDHDATETNPSNPNLLTAQCPLCATPVSSTLLEEFTIRHSQTARLPSRLQQKFCREHRAQTARDTWQHRGYPDIDWDQLANIRITRHLHAIRSILQNKTPSFYRDKLVDATQAGKGRRNLLKYLKEGVLDVVKYGYYGPRGAKVAAEAITLRLSRELVEGSKRDVVVRDAGAGGFVQAVLVPEMVGRWVAEDRGVRLEGEGWKEEVRRVLEESCEVGALVHEDEDRVVVAVGEGREGYGRGERYMIDLDEEG